VKKATKTTIARLTKLAKKDNYAAELLGEIIQQANAHDELVEEGFDPDLTGAWAFNSADHIYVRVQRDFDKKVLRGLSTRFEKLIQCTLTYGLNECIILDINKLTKLLAE